MIKVLVLANNKKKYDITDLVTDVTWSGDINTLCRTLEVTVRNMQDLTVEKKMIVYGVGNGIVFYYDNKEVFRGYIFQKENSADGTEKVTAYDELIYATKNVETVLIKNKTASDVITSQLKKFNMEIGSIEKTNFKVKKLLQEAVTLADIWKNMLEEEKKNSGKSFHIFSSKGKVYMWSRGKAAKKTISIDDIFSGSRTESVEELRNKVTITKGSLDPSEKSDTKFKSVTVSDSKNIEKFGMMQHIETADDDASLAQMKTKAKSILEQMNKAEVTANIDFLGDIDCITCRKISVKDRATALSGEFFITSDSHTFSGGTHNMSLQISKQLE